MAWATRFLLLSWSGVILSAVFSAVMRCSTVSGLLEVAAAAAGGLPVPPVCADAGPSEPATSTAPAKEAIASERTMGVNKGRVMNWFLSKGDWPVRRVATTVPKEENVRLVGGFRVTESGALFFLSNFE